MLSIRLVLAKTIRTYKLVITIEFVIGIMRRVASVHRCVTPLLRTHRAYNTSAQEQSNPAALFTQAHVELRNSVRKVRSHLCSTIVSFS